MWVGTFQSCCLSLFLIKAVFWRTRWLRCFLFVSSLSLSFFFIFSCLPVDVCVISGECCKKKKAEWGGSGAAMNIKLPLSYEMLIVGLFSVCYCIYEARGATEQRASSENVLNQRGDTGGSEELHKQCCKTLWVLESRSTLSSLAEECNQIQHEVWRSYESWTTNKIHRLGFRTCSTHLIWFETLELPLGVSVKWLETCPGCIPAFRLCELGKAPSDPHNTVGRQWMDGSEAETLIFNH